MVAYIFNVTYEIVTEESAEQGDTDERGFIAESVGLREAIDYLHETRTNEVDGVTCIETDCDSRVRPHSSPRFITVYNGMEFRTGATESRTLHIPRSVSAASARRIARIAGVPS